MTTNPNRIEDFLAKLAQKTPKAKEMDAAGKNRKLEKIYLNYPENFGRYQILPMDSIINDFPFVPLFGTREINMPRKNIGADGQASVYEAWIKILPKEAYQMKDDTGRVVSSLTASDEQLLNQAYMIFDQLFEELDARNNREPSVTKLIRKRNYTIFHGMCLNKWGVSDIRNPNRQNFCGLFVCTAKGFMNAVESNIEEKILMSGGDNSWLPQIYNRQLSGREGFIMFSISNNKTQAGYVVSVSHEYGKGKTLENNVISEEDAELMSDPVQSFLGWQAAKDENNNPYQKRLFNPSLIQETIQYMSQQLASIRMAKQSGISIDEAINRTNEEALSHQTPTNTMGEATNDPMLASMSGSSVGVNPGNIVNNNNNPFQTPPAANIDPVTSSPVTHSDPVQGGNPFTNPGFGSGNNQQPPFNPSFGNFGGGSF